MSFAEILLKARNGEKDLFDKLLSMYAPLLTKLSVVDGVYDEDLHQELCITLWQCVRSFDVEKEFPGQD